MEKRLTLDSILNTVKENAIIEAQILFGGCVKTGKKASYSRSESMLGELTENSNNYLLDSPLNPYDNNELFFKSTCFLEKGQFDKLKRMYEVLPEAIPEPISRVRRPDGKEVGYIMKKIEGTTMSKYLDGLDGNMREMEKDRILTELNRYVEKLHAKGIAHGDIHRRNIMIYNGKPFLIDPFSVGKCEELYKQRDIKNLERLKSPKY